MIVAEGTLFPCHYLEPRFENSANNFPLSFPSPPGLPARQAFSTTASHSFRFVPEKSDLNSSLDPEGIVPLLFRGQTPQPFPGNFKFVSDSLVQVWQRRE